MLSYFNAHRAPPLKPQTYIATFTITPDRRSITNALSGLTSATPERLTGAAQLIEND